MTTSVDCPVASPVFPKPIELEQNESFATNQQKSRSLSVVCNFFYCFTFAELLPNIDKSAISVAQ